MRDLADLHRVSAQYPSGRLLRRYWHPIAFSKDVQAGQAQRVRLLAEDLVLWRTRSGGLGLGVEACPHRRASLAYGMVEGENLRCSYHGWLFDRDGTCHEKPFQPKFARRKCAWTTFAAREYCGLVFAYLGPLEKIPPLPNWDIFNRANTRQVFEIQEDLNCNWLQVQENAADTTHTHFLHGIQMLRRTGSDETGFSRKLRMYGFQPTLFGLIKTWEYEEGGFGYGNILVFPNILALQTEMHWRVPIDEFTTRIFWLGIHPVSSDIGTDSVTFVVQPDRTDGSGRYTMETFSSQDAMAVETAGKVANRELEQLSASDLGVQLFRKMFLGQMQVNEQGGDPFLTQDVSPFERLSGFMGGDLPSTCLPDLAIAGKNFGRFEALKTADYVEVRLGSE